jgi:hypothetical protein
MIRSRRLSFGSDRVDGSGGACCLTAVANSVPAWTKAVPSALFDRYREAYRRVSKAVPGGAWGVRPLRACTADESPVPFLMESKHGTLLMINTHKHIGPRYRVHKKTF